jgi:RNA polymerase-binding transcription factor
MAKANRTETLLRGWQIQKQDGLGRRRALEALLRGRRHAFPEPPATHAGGPDSVDVAREQEEEMVWLAVMDRSHTIQVQVYEALRRLVDGKYGLCIDCGEPISGQRLRALPFALRCLRCQERSEAESDRVSRSSRTVGDQRVVAAPTEERRSISGLARAGGAGADHRYQR